MGLLSLGRREIDAREENEFVKLLRKENWTTM